MAQTQYQVVLTGELLPGAERESAISGMAKLFSAQPDTLRGLFDGTSHPLAQQFTAEQARAVRARLEKIGVDSRVERKALDGPKLALDTSAEEDEVALSVVAANMAEGAGVATPRNAGTRPSYDRNNPHWNRGWDDFEEDESDEERALGLFMGPQSPRYVQVFERFGKMPRPKFALSWNWGAFFSPFLWTMYRKMWFWAIVTVMTGVLVPVVLLILHYRGVLPDALVPVPIILIVLNHLFWPAVVDYLYFRKVYSSLAHLHRLSPTSPHESEIATAGGTSFMASFAGAAVAAVILLFTWSVIDSMGIGGSGPQGGYIFDFTADREQQGEHTPLRQSASISAVPGVQSGPVNKWGETRTRLRGLAAQINAWLIRSAGAVEPMSLTSFKLREQVGVAEAGMRDAWGAEIQYIPDVEGFRLISSGPDQLFGTADDIQFKQVLGR